MRLAKRRKVRPHDPVAVVTRFLDAANHHDADGLRACVHPEFESFQPLHPARNFRGAGQLISNWKAIFEAEPGFRLTLLRASTTGNTVWAEIHGAGASAEAAGIFIVGVEDGRIRWIRVYSDLVEPLPEEPFEEEPAPSGPVVDWDRDPIRLVPPPDAGDGEAAAVDEPEVAAGEAAGDDQEEVVAVAGDGPGLRLVGADAAVDEEPATAAEAPDVAEAPAVSGGEVPATGGGDSIEVLVGDAPDVEAEPATAGVPSGPDPEADAKEAAAAVDEAPASPAVDAESGEQPGGAWWDTVAGLGTAGPDPSGPEVGPVRRRLGFLRRGGRGSGS